MTKDFYLKKVNPKCNESS